MKISWIARSGLLIGLSLLFSAHPANAGDRKEVGRARSDSRFPEVVTPSASVASPHHSSGGAFWVTNSTSKFERSHPDLKGKEKEAAATSARERKKIILFRFDQKFGDVSVQPVFGPVNGAQVCVGF